MKKNDWEKIFLPTILEDLNNDNKNKKLLNLSQLGAYVFFRTVIKLPALVRSWWNDKCSRSDRSWASKYFEDVRYSIVCEYKIYTTTDFV
jgi:hypothetical protein